MQGNRVKYRVKELGNRPRYVWNAQTRQKNQDQGATKEQIRDLREFETMALVWLELS